MASSPKGLRLLKTLEQIKNTPSFDATAVLKRVKLHSASDGVLKGSFTIEPSMCNLGNTLHGGHIASLVDVFSFYSQLSHPDGRLSWTTNLNIIFVGSAKEGETVNVESKPVRSGNAAIVETCLYGCNGNLLAKGTATFVAGHEKYQQVFKDGFNFNVQETD
ncbi:unnamed protein product [Arctia plantaginis]|uniref:Thioesterase domain-containing protein n=1 Tax=Arctia plantaginis TaxID=874455 RepID=A0A8S1ASE0_ARCPL|nr:unnamed protein product [Arctia plantaginis]CAB3249397.1 unnamed protein product [Arctia plantaginis]